MTFVGSPSSISSDTSTSISSRLIAPLETVITFFSICAVDKIFSNNSDTTEVKDNQGTEYCLLTTYIDY